MSVSLSRSLLCAVVIAGSTASAFAADPFPADPGAPLSTLSNSFEPSGLAWHEGLDRLFVVSDEGTIAQLSPAGAVEASWTVAGADLEGITVADPMSDFVYLGVEDPDAIIELDLVSGQVTRTFDVTAFMQSQDETKGLEALTFVPDGGPEGGLFYAGLQEDGLVYVFELPIRSSAVSTTVTFVGTLAPGPGLSDLSGLHYHAANDTLYAVFDNPAEIHAVVPQDGQLIASWELAGWDQEGVVVHGCDLYVAEDPIAEVWRYPRFPAGGDSDGDGVDDCRDDCPDTAPGETVGPDGCSGCQGGGATAVCGDGVCNAGDGEDCLSCPDDCRGKQKGKASTQYCCGAGGGVGAVGCADPRCSADGLACSDGSTTPSCCGDAVCDASEACDCAADCGAPPADESGADACSNGTDDDCDGLVDCAEASCSAVPACVGPVCDGDGQCDAGEDCAGCPSDCAGVLKGKPATRHCCGDGAVEGPEIGDPGLCDGNP